MNFQQYKTDFDLKLIGEEKEREAGWGRMRNIGWCDPETQDRKYVAPGRN